MKIIAKATHFDIEIDPAEVPAEALSQLIESITRGEPLGHGTLDIIVRDAVSRRRKL